jgi:Kef-type K+ transport system membrane component KefB/nucleotide-binding universal stress UspA family protein
MSEAIFVGEVALLIVAGRVLGEAMQRIGQTSVIGQLLAGILLGPSLFGLVWPEAQQIVFPPEQRSMIDGLSQFGILLLLLLTGMETDLALVKKAGRSAVSVAAAGVAIPFLCGFALGELLPDAMLPKPDQRLVTSLFLGTALSISSVKIVGVVVREMNFTRRNLGQIIVASAIIEDTIGWIIVAVTFGVASQGGIDAAGIARIAIGTALFLALSLTVGRRIVYTLIRWSNDSFESEFPVISMILVITAGMALITHEIGVHTVLGAFIAGVLIGESPILTRHIDEQLRGLVVALFMPVFFGVAGLSVDLTVLKEAHIVLFTIGVILVASIGKFGGAFIGGLLGRMPPRESLALGCAMNARGSTEVIVASIGLSMAVLSQTLFTMIVIMAVVTTMTMPPLLRWALSRIPLGAKERERLEREELDAKGFIPNLERLLLAADDSANGKLAARLAGLLAGLGGMPTTVVSLASHNRPKRHEAQPDRVAGTVEAAAATTGETKAYDSPSARADITTRTDDIAPERAVASEARKGHDFLIIGTADAGVPSGELPKVVNTIAGAFDGPIMVVAHAHTGAPFAERPNVLVPVNGTAPSRRAAELALAVARPINAAVDALYVSNASASRLRGKRLRSGQAQAILKDIVKLAERYEVDVRTSVRVDGGPDETILREARHRKVDLIVMGVARRSGEKLFFGNTGSTILERAKSPTVFVLS